MNERFRNVALALRDHVSDVYALLGAADAVVALDESFLASGPRPVIKSPDGNATYNHALSRWDYDHEVLVKMAQQSDDVLLHIYSEHKIDAIKELRAIVPGCGLKAAKDAVEDERVQNAAAMFDPAPPWEQHYDADEPPF